MFLAAKLRGEEELVAGDCLIQVRWAVPVEEVLAFLVNSMAFLCMIKAGFRWGGSLGCAFARMPRREKVTRRAKVKAKQLWF